MNQQQPANEPVAWIEILRKNPKATNEVIGAYLRGHAEHVTGEKFILESTPQPAAWVGLTTADLDEIYRAIEAKLREKNSGE